MRARFNDLAVKTELFTKLTVQQYGQHLERHPVQHRRALGVPKTLGKDNEKLVGGSPLTDTQGHGTFVASIAA